MYVDVRDKNKLRSVSSVKAHFITHEISAMPIIVKVARQSFRNRERDKNKIGQEKVEKKLTTYISR